MPFFLIIVGVALLVSAVRGTTSDLFTLLKGDFTGQGNFIYWALSILAIGAVGYVKKLQPISDAFLLLVIIVLFLVNNKQTGAQGFFGSFLQQIGSTQSPATTQLTNQSISNMTNPSAAGFQMLTPTLFSGV